MRNLFQISNQREIEKMKSDFHKKICLAFLVGTVIALAFGLLFAPKSGKDLREQVKKICKNYRKKVDSELYVGNVNSDIFHLSSCVHLPNSDNRIVYRNRDEAIASGKNPCHSCNP
ncbi:MAG: YtxH domain-containing protein [Clostridia bacterium]|nr:YtxH domain-containing protein [Clostridia bacterium]